MSLLFHCLLSFFSVKLFLLKFGWHFKYETFHYCRMHFNHHRGPLQTVLVFEDNLWHSYNLYHSVEIFNSQTPTDWYSYTIRGQIQWHSTKSGLRLKLRWQSLIEENMNCIETHSHSHSEKPYAHFKRYFREQTLTGRFSTRCYETAYTC